VQCARLNNMTTYVVPGKPTIMVDRAYFKLIQKDSEFLEYLEDSGVVHWEGYKDAEQEYNNDQEV